jgi:hypothetical protein
MSNKPKRYASKEALYIALSLVCMVVMIMITSLAEAGLDPAKIWSKSNVSNMLMNAAITLFGTLAAIPSGSVSTKQRTNPDGTCGRYLQEFRAYNVIRQKIETKRFMFNQWHHAQFLLEKYSKNINYLLEKNILQAEQILKLSREQIISLNVPQVYTVLNEEIYFRALSLSQIKACLKVYDGKITVHKLPDFYFLYIDGKGKRSFYDQAYYESRDENSTLMSKVFMKTFLGFLITCIFTGLIIDYTVTDQVTTVYILKTIFTIVARLFNAATSTFWGFLIGQESVYRHCYYINGKTQFLQAFDTDDTFEYKDLSQIAYDEYTDSQKEE